MECAAKNTIYIDSEGSYTFKQFTDALEKQLDNAYHIPPQNIVILCIGTDRSTGDSLGPLIGHKLERLHHAHAHVYGSLSEPVHAKNLIETLSDIKSKHPHALILAIDACLGSMEHVGYITVAKGSIKPGAGTNKHLPAVGDVSVTGIVNFSGFMDFLVLQNTRLNLVMKMADIISLGLKYVLWKRYRLTSSTPTERPLTLLH